MFKRTPSLLCAILSLFLSAATYASPWRFHGFLQAGLSADTIYPDPYLSSSRTPVFGEDGSGQASTDNSCIPRFLFEDGSGIKNCRDLSFDTPVYGGSISGSTLGVRRDWEKSSLVMESGFYSFTNPYRPQLSRLWFERGFYELGYGWSSFMGRPAEQGPMTVDYGGPVGSSYLRQFGVRLKLNSLLTLSLEEPQSEVLLGLIDFPDQHNSESVRNPRLLLSDPEISVGEPESYRVDRKLRKREVLPDLIFNYYNEGRQGSYFAALLLQFVRLDRNAPLFLDQDAGLLALIEDANKNDAAAVDLLDEELRLNDDLAGGLSATNLAVRIGTERPLGQERRILLSYIYNGGHYLRDNPNPAHIVAVDDPRCAAVPEVDCAYELVNVISHSYMIGLDFANDWNWLLSGTFTEDEFVPALGGASTKSLHSMHLNYRQALNESIGTTYEFAYLYHRTFNGRNNANHPRLRFQYALYYYF